jgi:hypothetical protein
MIKFFQSNLNVALNNGPIMIEADAFVGVVVFAIVCRHTFYTEGGKHKQCSKNRKGGNPFSTQQIL